MPVSVCFAHVPIYHLRPYCRSIACLQREDKERSKARKAAGKQAKPLWEEDGKRRGLLDKYDEEEEQMMQVGDQWRVVVVVWWCLTVAHVSLPVGLLHLSVCVASNEWWCLLGHD